MTDAENDLTHHLKSAILIINNKSAIPDIAKSVMLAGEYTHMLKTPN